MEKQYKKNQLIWGIQENEKKNSCVPETDEHVDFLECVFLYVKILMLPVKCSNLTM